MQKNKDPSEALAAAIQLLKKFNDQIDSGDTPNISRLDLKEGALVQSNQNAFFRKFDLVKSFISSALSSEARQKMKKKRDLIQEELNKAIEIVKSHYRLIHELKKGDEKQQEMANQAEEVIKGFKSFIKQSKEASLNLTQKIARFFYEQTGQLLNENLLEFDLPSPAPFAKKFFSTNSEDSDGIKFISTSFDSVSSRKIASLGVLGTKSDSIPLSKELKEAFYVKVFSLSRQHKIPVTFMELNKSVRSSPITAKKLEHSKIFMCQILSTIPGEIIRIEGDFRCVQPNENHAPAITGSHFELSYHYQPTGFPDPLYLGWTLAHPLIPECCHYPEQTPLLHNLMEKKKNVAQQLLPEGVFFERAKELLGKAKELFSTEYFDSQRELQHALLNASERPSLLEKGTSAINAFFDALKNKPDSFQLYTDIQHLVLNNFITKVYEQLQKDWMTGAFLFKPEQDFVSRFRVTQQYLRDLYLSQRENWQAQVDETTLNYIDLQMELLVESSFQIILQHLSEPMRFTPPQLTIFEHKLQVAAYIQLEAFFNLLENPIKLGDFLKELTATQIELFKSPSIESEIVFELESHFNTHYFNTRHRNSLKPSYDS